MTKMSPEDAGTQAFTAGVPVVIEPIITPVQSLFIVPLLSMVPDVLSMVPELVKVSLLPMPVGPVFNIVMVPELVKVPELEMPVLPEFDIVMVPELSMVPLLLKMPTSKMPEFDIVMVPELVMVPATFSMPTPLRVPDIVMVPELLMVPLLLILPVEVISMVPPTLFVRVSPLLTVTSPFIVIVLVDWLVREPPAIIS